MEHCIVDGKRCSKCCEVLTIIESKSFREWRSYSRRYGYPDDFSNEHKLPHLVRKISKRRAKKKNAKLVKRVNNSQSYFTCKNFTGFGCGDYENRPATCSKYPYYGKTISEWEDTDEFKAGGLYHKDCTYFIELK